MASVTNIIHWTRDRRGTIRRGLWLLMGVAHVPACLGAWKAVIADGSSAGTCLALTAAVAFFALKVVDADWLRFRTDRRSIIALIVVFAVLHVDLLRGADAPPLLADGTAVAAATWLLVLADPIRRLFKAAVASSGAGLMRVAATSRTANTFWLDAFHPHCWLLILRPHLLRAPPVHLLSLRAPV